MIRLARTTAPILAALLVAVGTSCAIPVTGPLDEGSHAAIVRGAVTASFGGWAGFGADRSGWGISLLPWDRGGDGWVMHLYQRGPRPPDGTTVFVGHRAQSGAVETHAIGDVSNYVSPGPADFWETRTGWIRIHRSTPQRLVGTFEITLQPPEGSNAPGPITVTGTFTAFCFLSTDC